MAVGDVIKEFVVAIGFDVDEPSLDKVTSQLKGVASKLAEIGTAFVGATVGLGAIVDNVASRLEKLYYTAARTGTTVKNLKEVGYAAEQTGIGSEAAQASIQQMAVQFWQNPALKDAMGGMLGIATEGRDTSEIWLDMMSKLHEMGQQGFGYQAAAYGGMAGISPEMIMGFRPEEMQKWREDYRRREAGAAVDLDKEAEKQREFKQTTRGLGAELELTETKIADGLEPSFVKLNQTINGLAESLTKLNPELLASSTALITLVTALTGVAGGGVGAAAGILGGLGLFAAEKMGAFNQGQGGGGVFDWVGKKGAEFTQYMEGKSATVYPGLGGATVGIGHLVKPGEKFDHPLSDAEQDALFKQDWATARATVVRQIGKVQLNEKMIDALTDLAYRTGSLYNRRTGQPTDILAAIRSGNLDAVGDLFSEYNKYQDQKGNMQIDPSATRRTLGEAQMWRQGLSELRGVNIQTTINVNGVGDPEAVAQSVADKQKDVNQQNMRNLMPRTN